jgi:hypothetical protein
MKAIQAIWKDGRIIPSQPVDWPDGTALNVEPVEELSETESEEGLYGKDPESIAWQIAACETLPRLTMTEAEEAEWLAARQDVKEYTVAKMQGLSWG